MSAHLQNYLDDCREWKADLENRAQIMHTELVKKQEDLREIQGLIDLYDHEKMKESDLLKSALDEEKGAKIRRNEATKEVMSAMFNPANIFSSSIWTDVKSFYKSQIQGKMPKGMTKNWFNEIMDNHETCICGTKWTAEMREYVDENKEDFLDELLIPRVKTMQTEVVNSINETTLEQMKRKIDAHRRR